MSELDIAGNGEPDCPTLDGSKRPTHVESWSCRTKHSKPYPTLPSPSSGIRRFPAPQREGPQGSLPTTRAAQHDASIREYPPGRLQNVPVESELWGAWSF